MNQIVPRFLFSYELHTEGSFILRNPEAFYAESGMKEEKIRSNDGCMKKIQHVRYRGSVEFHTPIELEHFLQTFFFDGLQVKTNPKNIQYGLIRFFKESYHAFCDFLQKEETGVLCLELPDELDCYKEEEKRQYRKFFVSGMLKLQMVI